MTIKLDALSKIYTTPKNKVCALLNTTLTITDHSFTIVVGKSGCGKTTLLRLLSGLEVPSSGTIEFSSTKPKIGFVFQEPRLMPWLTVSENIAFSAKTLCSSQSQIPISEISSLLTTLGLTKFAKAYPSQLSGGMAQRVALGRTLLQNPDIILMDEPFSALDYFTRHGLQETLLTLFQKERKTIIFVTHDVEEAILLGERILIMQNGNVTADIPVTIPYPRELSATSVINLRKQILTGIE
jgi:sulfonate transport system ATP-binding protein